VLINDFYTCRDIEQGASDYSCRLVFNEHHAIFKGHFPGQPVVPGVCMMEIVKELLEGVTGKPLMLRSSQNVKFLRLTTPDLQPVMKIAWKEAGEEYHVDASSVNDAVPAFKFSGNYVVSAMV
jgi:3-hydroxyacyl-[acyl-carrier-protein] dehydratase